MKDEINELLRSTDPLANEAGLSAAEIRAMRHAIIAARADSQARAWSPGPFAVAATVAVTLAVGVFVGMRFEPVPPPDVQPRAIEQRQLQFETPGGTRVVWVLNPGLDF